MDQKYFFSNFDPVEEYSQDDTSNYDPAITHTLQNHAFLEFTFRWVYFSLKIVPLKIFSRFFDQDGHPQSNNHGTRQNTRRSMTQQRHHHRQHQGRRWIYRTMCSIVTWCRDFCKSYCRLRLLTWSLSQVQFIPFLLQVEFVLIFCFILNTRDSTCDTLNIVTTRLWQNPLWLNPKLCLLYSL